MEAEKSLSQNLDVADLTTSLVTRPVPMPICRYDVLDGGPNGAPVQFAVVGQQVYHKFTCDVEVQDVFCMSVRSCYTTSEREDEQRVQVLDDNGCALDKYVLYNLEYPTDLSAGQASHLFRYC